jgi:hypothetical protein
MLALSLPQAMLGAERERSLASSNQSGSTAPALHTKKARILARIFSLLSFFHRRRLSSPTALADTSSNNGASLVLPCAGVA